MAEQKKPLGRPVTLPDAQSDEAAAPKQADVERADALAEADPLLRDLWLAGPTNEDAS